MERKFDSFVHKADTMIILHLIQAAQSTREEKVIVVRLSDTDVFLLLFKFSQDIDQSVLFDTGVSNKRKPIDARSVIIRKAWCKL